MRRASAGDLDGRLAAVAHDSWPRTGGRSARFAGTPVHIDGLPSGRLPTDVEQAAYAVIAEALAGPFSGAFEQDGQLTVRADGAVTGADGVLPDMIAALGGRIQLGSRIEAVIPCVS